MFKVIAAIYFVWNSTSLNTYTLFANIDIQQVKKILIVTSNQEFYGNTMIKTANHFAEIVHAYDVFKSQGFKVDIISPKGGNIPIGYIDETDSIQKMYLKDDEFMSLLKNTKPAEEIDPEDYIGIYYSGGGSAMFGVPKNNIIKKIAEKIYSENGIISAVCHGTAGITFLTDKDKKPLYKDREVTGYPEFFEDTNANYYKSFSFSIEKKIQENLGIFKFVRRRNANFYIVDGRFVTGQDPSSTVSVAEKVVTLINSLSD